MSGPDLRIVDKDFTDAISSMKRIEASFESMQDDDGTLSDAVGHAGLRSKVESFSNSWRIKRGDLTKAISAHRKELEAVRDTFTEIDNKWGEPSPQDNGGGGSGGSLSQSLPTASAAPGSVGSTNLAASTLSSAATDEKVTTPVVGDSSTSPNIETVPSPVVDQLKNLFGDAVDVVLESDSDGDLALRIGSVSGISLVALTTLLAFLTRGGSGSTIKDSDQVAVLRSSLTALLGDSTAEDRTVTPGPNRDDILAGLLPGHEESADGAVGTLASATGSPTSAGGGEALQETGTESLADQGSGHQTLGGAGTGDEVGTAGPAPGTAALDVGGGLSMFSANEADAQADLVDGVGAPLPTDARASAPETDPSAGSSSSGARTEDPFSSRMYGGMGMAAGMGASAAARGSGDEEKRNEEARRLRERLAQTKETDR